MEGESPRPSTPVGAIFLSYASQDGEAATRICEALRSGGIEVWFDQSELRGGDAWDASIRRQIKTCALFVPVISGNTDAREEGYFRLEWKLAVDRSHLMAGTKAFLLPVVIDDTSDDDDRVPDKFREVQWTRLPNGHTPPAFVERVSRLLGPEHAGQPALLRPAAAHRAPDAGPSVWAAATGKVAATRTNLVLLLITAAALIAIGYFTLDRLLLSKRSADAVRTAATGLSGISAQSGIPEKSIAVLPFIDLSDTHDQEYFSDGLSEEIIDRLVRVPDLHVPARTSSFYFKGKQVTVADIARTLGVAHVLEGSVRKSKTRLRVTAQLIRAENGYHLWSQTYDRELTDVFKLQDDIAGTVAKELTGFLLPATSESADPTHVEAYALLWHGREYANRGTKADNDEAKKFYRQALNLVPDYALALAWLGGAYQNDAVNEWAPRAEACAAARALGESAVRLAPDLAEAHVTRGNYFFNCTSEWRQADAHFTRATELAPRSARVLAYRGSFLSDVLGRPEEGARLMQQAVYLDPLRFAYRSGWVDSLTALGQLDEAEHEARVALQLGPNRPFFHASLGEIELQRGRLSQAIAECDAEPDTGSRLACRAKACSAARQTEQSDAALAELIDRSAANNAIRIAEVYAFRRDPTNAVRWLKKGFEAGESWAGSWLGDRSIQRLPEYPRYAAFIRETWKLP